MSVEFTTDQMKWEAVATRDPQAESVFLYAVKTTGIYCRPGCASRTPNRANVLFFESALLAERAGFRACKKCQPATPITTPAAVLQACELLDASYDPIPLTTLAEAVGLSSSHFHRVFKKTVGITPKAYATARRAAQFRSELSKEQSVTAAVYEAGYHSSSRCYEEVGNQLGMTPTVYRRGGEGMSVRFAVEPCSLGWIGIAMTNRGICMIELCDDEESAKNTIQERFPHAIIEEHNPQFQELVRQVVESVSVPTATHDLPLDVQGTAFQRKVWEVLRTIPPGETVTYTDIAETIGQPTAARAVARACATNPIAVVIPCHRVIGKNGKLSGYRWGLERKEELLKCEAKLTETELSSKSTNTMARDPS